MSDYLQVVTTVPSRQQADSLATALVEQRLAACVQVQGPLASTYWWQGQIDHAEEWQVTAKTRRERYAAIEEAIARLHPYDTPEILALPLVHGSPRYLEWIDRELDA